MSSWQNANPSPRMGAKQDLQGAGGRPNNLSEWPPYRLPSEYAQGTTHMASSGSAEPISRSSLSLQPIARAEGFPAASNRGQATPGLSLQSTSSHVPVAAPLQSSSAYNVNQSTFGSSVPRPLSFNEGSVKSEMYHMAHLSFPKTWVHLWDRAPLREAETFLSTVCYPCCCYSGLCRPAACRSWSLCLMYCTSTFFPALHWMS